MEIKTIEGIDIERKTLVYILPTEKGIQKRAGSVRRPLLSFQRRATIYSLPSEFASYLCQKVMF